MVMEELDLSDDDLFKGKKSVFHELKDEINKLEKIVKGLTLTEEAEREAAKKKSKKGKKGAAEATEEPAVDDVVFDLPDDAGTSSAAPISEQQRLRMLVNDVQADCRREKVDLPLVRAKMERVGNLWNVVMVDEMRNALKDSAGGTVVQTLDPAEITEQAVIAAMDDTGVPDIKLTEYKKKREQPKGVSRAVWMEHLKMAKKFAECIAHMCAVHRSGSTANLDWSTTEAALAAVELWEEKWCKNAAMMKEINRLVAYEIISRVKDFEYYNCLFCNVVEFNVKQFLSHFASGAHCKKARELMESEERTMMFGFAAKSMMNLTVICDDLHGFFSQQFTTPLVKSGAKVPQPGKNSIPTLEYLEQIEQKYGMEINGEIDTKRLNDSAYIALLLPGVVQRHTSAIGKQLFKELAEYLANGTSLYCHRCHWKVSNRASFYRHVLNPYHVSMNYLNDGHQFNLLTVSINVHLKADAC
ncbi:hypothetical protein PMAYCL1PPCAC_22163 [Pristionchus mayeri]|uniref:Uncharacterized protein n=1 Tax=Pristionchus mayeri TaxID=1317129 RepID=A0AAN5CW90_9BILA|nr:hypothetical protein PMAYCL1PPCAC_22163 [Pristionchus mayeri]